MDVPLSMSQPQVPSNRDPKMRCLADFKVEKEIGEGSFSTVYLGREKEGPKREVAIKVCMKSLILKKKMVPYIHREKEALALLNRPENLHPSIVALFATFHDAESLYFVLSYAKYGDLCDLTEKQPHSRLKLEDARYYAANLLSALSHIHSLGIIHRDVKPENLLVKEDGRILLSDFGTAKFLRDYETCEESTATQSMPRRGSFVGTANFATPEMLDGQQMGPYSDLWAFACTLFFMLTGENAFEDPSEYLIFKRIKDLLFRFPDTFDASAKDLIERVLVIKCADRMSSEQLKEHNFFELINFNALQDLEPPKIYLM